jgi:flagellar M-ring protein FliF
VDSELIAVENFSFHSPDVAVTGPPPEEEGIDRKWIYIGIGAAVLLAVIAFVVVTLLRKKRRDEEVEEMELPTGEEALGVLFGEGEPPPITPVKDVRKEQIREFAMSNPEIAAQMIRSWLRAEDEE